MTAASATAALDSIARLEGISYRYPGQAAAALRDVGLSIEPGLTLLAGGSGGGKSTLLRLLNGLVPQFHGGRISGSAVVAGMDPLRTPIPRLATRVGLVFQEPETQSVYGSVEREVAFGLENLGLPRAQMQGRVDEALSELGIEALRTRRLSTLSGGERQRVQLAAVLALRPQLIALDEPLSQLDPQGSRAVLAAIRRLATTGLAVVVAEHRLEALLPVADRLLVVEAGEAFGPGGPRELAARLASPPAIVELGLELGWDPLPLTVEQARSRPDLPPPGPMAPRRLPGEGPGWEARGLAVGFGPEALLEGVSIGAAAGEIVALIGPNGSGKTTLLRTLAGLLPELAGTVRRPDGRTAYLPQNPGAMLHLPTLRAEVELTLRRTEAAGHAGDFLGAFGLADLAERYPRDLSAGERQRAALAATLAGSPALALLDEPTRGMDLAARRGLGTFVRSMSRRGGAVVVATHDLDLAAEVADRVMLVADGRVVDLGAPERAFGSESPHATQIGELFPGGPVTVPAALAAIGPAARPVAARRRGSSR
jgi:energy-coupling factor transport system ATP-binding protein